MSSLLLFSSAGNHVVVAPPVPCLPSQESALLRLKRSFIATDYSAIAFRSWRAGTDCCRWVGVRCADTDGRVISLNLGGRGLERSLEYLDVGGTNFFGVIPTSISNLTSLKKLGLASSGFSGEIPSSIGYLKSLSALEISGVGILDLSNNMLEGPIPIPQGSASVLDYSNNMFSSIPSHFSSHLSDVTIFMASGNNFTGNFPSSFCGITNIQLLDLSYNKFSGYIPSCLMQNANSLQSLNLNQNQFYGELPDNIKEGCSFEALDFSSNWIEGKLPRSLVACKNLQILDVGNNQISDSFPCWMSKLPKLEILVLKSNKFFGQVAQSTQEEKSASVGVLDLLVGLNMSHNSLTGPIPSQLSHLTQLEALDLSSNELYGEIPLDLKTLDALTVLNLSNNKLVGSIPESPHFMTFSNSSFLGNDGLCGLPLSKLCINTPPSNAESHQSERKYVDIFLFLFAGLGFGVGFAIATVAAWGIPTRKQS
ncbi:hypothetical protein PR202_ga23379 [Eleusine coracana subsp. coracana]|uniref:Leucine-rich repeat-containing N-terminal plant-type domain-containing protein n=1 Tax=Eleusine coracana subsp. coracana TaxID=191504 RepID=A0AAV5D5P4_ELECO|nr:hypothetical protein PR202_ga23379 [Eleusine coracana subsp. coracana]